VLHKAKSGVLSTAALAHAGTQLHLTASCMHRSGVDGLGLSIGTLCRRQVLGRYAYGSPNHLWGCVWDDQWPEHLRRFTVTDFQTKICE
jgi:hypothetical protein